MPPLSLLHPRHWPTWLIVACLYLATKLTLRQQYALGRNLGKLLLRFAKRSVKTTEINLALCFPTLDATEKKRLLNACFINAGIAVFEAANGFWAPACKLAHLTEFSGLEHVQNALAKGRGVILIGSHQTSLQLAGRLYSLIADFGVVYRKQHNLVFNWLSERALNKHYAFAISSTALLKLKSALKKGRVVWYTPDIDPRDSASLFAPFFGIQAATVTIPSYFAEKLNVTLVPVSYYRKETGVGYTINFSEPLNTIPSGDRLQDTQTINDALEAIITKHPDQYFWQYKRFKTRPPGQPNPYKLELPIKPGVIT